MRCACGAWTQRGHAKRIYQGMPAHPFTRNEHDLHKENFMCRCGALTMSKHWAKVAAGLKPHKYMP